MFAKFSPDGQSVAYVRENNHVRQKIWRREESALTTDGTANDHQRNLGLGERGRAVSARRFRWSPDSQRSRIGSSTESGVREYTLINDTEEGYPMMYEYKYPQAGTNNSAVRVGVVSASRRTDEVDPAAGRSAPALHRADGLGGQLRRCADRVPEPLCRRPTNSSGPMRRPALRACLRGQGQGMGGRHSARLDEEMQALLQHGHERLHCG